MEETKTEGAEIDIPAAKDPIDAAYAAKVRVLTECDLASKRVQKAQALAIAGECDLEIAKMEAFLADISRRAVNVGFPVADKGEGKPEAK